MRSPGVSILYKRLLWLPMCLYLLISGGCATLPKADEIVQESPGTANPPTIIAAHKELSARESRALIKRLKSRTLPADILERHIAVEETISGRPLNAGNKVTLLVDGPATYAAMSKLIQNATDHVNFETFTYEDDATGRGFADILLQKAAQGVQVNLIYDAVGSLQTSSSFFRHLRGSGIQVLEFNPINPVAARGRWLQTITHRDHRKLLIGDGAVAITGGVNITSDYSASISESSHREKDKLPWRDTDVQIEGPAVAEFQRLFMDTWKRENGPELAKKNYFPPLKQAGNELVRVIGSTPGRLSRTTYMMYLAAISCALNTIHLTSPYFVPDEQMLNALTDAAKRGVDVKIILPAKSDSEMAFYAGRSHYSQLLSSGVKLYEHRNTILHAKTAVIDGVWSSVGSTNMDLWSFLRNDEVNAVILGREFANQMEAMFIRDIENSDVVHLAKWEQRSFQERMREWSSRLFGYWL
jgi:cardiolipin synthase A/B